jgi:hypothetical protein
MYVWVCFSYFPTVYNSFFFFPSSNLLPLHDPGGWWYRASCSSTVSLSSHSKSNPNKQVECKCVCPNASNASFPIYIQPHHQSKQYVHLTSSPPPAAIQVKSLSRGNNYSIISISRKKRGSGIHNSGTHNIAASPTCLTNFP